MLWEKIADCIQVCLLCLTHSLPLDHFLIWKAKRKQFALYELAWGGGSNRNQRSEASVNNQQVGLTVASGAGCSERVVISRRVEEEKGVARALRRTREDKSEKYPPRAVWLDDLAISQIFGLARRHDRCLPCPCIYKKTWVWNCPSIFYSEHPWGLSTSSDSTKVEARFSFDLIPLSTMGLNPSVLLLGDACPWRHGAEIFVPHFLNRRF